MLKLMSWNVNGIRAVHKKGFVEWLTETSPDVLGLQETKIQQHQLTAEMLTPPGYYSFWSHSERPGYSGTAIYTKEKPLEVHTGMGIPQFDCEGRIVRAHYPNFTLLNVYFPNGTSGDVRLQYKMDFYSAFLDHINTLRAAGHKVIVCGDVNTAHAEIDLARPKENENVSGFLPIERAWMDQVIANDYIDSFRHFHPDKREAYTWWHMRTRARERNIGWRIDYFLVDKALLPNLTGADYHPHVLGSDHCPVSIDLSF